MNRLQRLIQLNAKISSMVNLAYGPDDDPYNQQRSALGTAATVGAGGALAAGGLYAAGARKAGLSWGQTAKMAGQDIAGTGGALPSLQNAGRTIRQGAGATGDALKGLIAKLKGGAVKTAEHGLSSRLERLMELRAKTDAVIQFKEEDRTHPYQRALLGLPVTTAINAKKGQKLAGFRHGLGHVGVEGAKGLGIGAAAGAGIGAWAGKGIGRGRGAALGASLGANIGADVGLLKGHIDKRSGEIVEKYHDYDAIGELIRFEDTSNHYVSRAILGAPLTGAITAKKGKRLASFGQQTGHVLGTEAGYGALGALGGRAAGATLGALSHGKINPMETARLGTAAGAIGGLVIGGHKATYDQRGTELLRKYQK